MLVSTSHSKNGLQKCAAVKIQLSQRAVFFRRVDSINYAKESP